jgi:hypothetical protein
MDLENITFGNQVAENEADNLAAYFVETQAWTKLFNGDVDVIFGSKGAGKSALYTLLLKNKKELKSKQINLLSAEKPTGQTVFSDITEQPPTQEKEFITLWKIYFCQLIVSWLDTEGLCENQAAIVKERLVEAGLIEEKNTLKRLVNNAKSFAHNLFTRLEALEGGATLEGVTGKITFYTPNQDERLKGYYSVDELLNLLNTFLEGKGETVWILCDRLDVAFEQSLDLEKNALRALFKSYLDIKEYKNISVKIFLRDDIWNRIIKEGFREATHINNEITIKWNRQNLMNLVVRRALQNQQIIDKYNITSEDVLSDYQKQIDFYYKMFPKQVDVGEKQSETFDWVLNRIKDGHNNIAPRELIHYYNETILREAEDQQIAKFAAEEPNIVSRASIKAATYEVSKGRIEKTLYAEYAELKDYIGKFENKKAEHNLSSLSEILEVDEPTALSLSSQLTEIGFFESKPARQDKIYKIPFMYRPYLNISQGKSH